jgi:DNA-binding HxlR family transcriptional regulator
MLGSSYQGQNCSAARALEAIGERWSLLIIRDALFRSMTRFSDFQRSLGIATNVLTARLEGFVAAGIMEKSMGESASPEYRLTEKGRDLAPVIMALTAWGDRWAAPYGPPIVFEHSCGSPIEQALTCRDCGTIVDYNAVNTRPGPGSFQTSKRSRAAARAGAGKTTGSE